MKVLYVLFAIAATAIPACNAASVETNDETNTITAGGRKLLRSNDEDTGSIHEEREGIMPLEEELEELAELVETHHHIREVFTKWCLEHETPESIEKDGSKDEKTVELYKKYMNAHAKKDKEGKKLYNIECNV
ncbi:hypothetical protein P3T76_002792 [Phytophthora citrophthora]|uniref:RxLR effector protein n=1 Tax=Phytophthora citrophthora TaxID=4793 RepID=A0AAD9LT49_9STRA|nr:hypothetical protein P3T76_002792 [Phytophthora citrophthora]